ncbi:hypothetical protein HDE_14250 [Halotydeus destructor]|nr:hypothetical protein HDE_14250 [Halotydeus destructor]
MQVLISVLSCLNVALYISATVIYCENGNIPTHYDIGTRGGFAYKNPSIGLDDVDELSCALVIERSRPEVVQIAITLTSLRLAQPTDGDCVKDVATFNFRDSKGGLVGRPPFSSLCGSEPEDAVRIGGETINIVNRFYLDFKHDRLDINIFTTGANFNRRFSITFEPIYSNTPSLAPPGCDQHFTANDGVAIYRSLNYQFRSVLGNQRVVTCFTSGDPERQLKFITLTPRAIGHEDPFSLGHLVNAQQDGRCRDSDHLELSSPSSRGNVTSFCGSRFNEKRDATGNGNVTVMAIDGLVKVTYVHKGDNKGRGQAISKGYDDIGPVILPNLHHLHVFHGNVQVGPILSAGKEKDSWRRMYRFSVHFG